MKRSSTPQQWQLVEIWGDTTDTRHLACSIGIGIVISLAAFLLSSRWLSSHVASPQLAHAYAMLAGLAGCLVAGVICAVLFKPKREVVEGDSVDPFWREEVIAKLAEHSGGLGSVEDLPPAVIKEMKELQIYELFAAHNNAKSTTVDEAGLTPAWITPLTEKQS